MKKMKLKRLLIITMIVSSLLFITTFSIEATEAIITDTMGDVTSTDYIMGQNNVVTSHPDINVDNLDLIQAFYTQQGSQATVSLQVKGNIENRGKIINPYIEDFSDTLNNVEYEFTLSTSEQDYSISYVNNAGILLYANKQINLTSSDFSVVGNTLTISFVLTSADETYSKLSVSSTYIKANLSEETMNRIYLSDVAPNPPITIYDASASNIGSIGESIQFNASIEPFTGQPPFTYHWDFGDQRSSTQLNPTHIYTKTGAYKYTFTVTDNAGATTSQSGTITISGDVPLSAHFTWTPTSTTPGKTITFNASTSNNPYGSIALYEWDWNNDDVYEESYTTSTATHSWPQAGNYSVTVRVTDNDGATSTKTISIPISSGSGNDNTTRNDNTTGNDNADNKGTPGFELVFVICAIAVSILMWKKKRNV